ncbi:wound-induced protein [Striga asiatica]|uniref:Wound-induced protein n=1 Tax=Striga asiatica TaxID=4170 RepID=A0A5A7RAV4_STRAF|nr:wound-induced protein [Striga asiatica]
MEAQNANPSPDNQNAAAVRRLYTALSDGGNPEILSLVSGDLEWWFHGPPNSHHMMKVLTGETPPSDFRFEPRGVAAVGGGGGCVVAEGWKGDQVYWVHVWTVEGGRITQLREYFNTWLTVKDLRPLRCSSGAGAATLWRSHHDDVRSMPGLMLPI